MIKKITLAALSVLFANIAFSQALPKGSMNICVGYGYNAFTKFITDSWSSEPGFSSSAIGPAHAKFEYMVSDKIGLGLSANYLSYKLKYDDSYYDDNFVLHAGTASLTFSSISALGRVNFYFVNTDHFTVYTGVGVGYRTGTWTAKSDDPNYPTQKYPSYSPFGMEITSGMKAMFTPNIGAYLEVGMAKSQVQAGLCIGFGGSGEGGGGGRGGSTRRY